MHQLGLDVTKYDHSCLTVSRKYGFGNLIKGSAQWTID